MPTTDGGIWYPDTTYAADSLTTAFSTMASSIDEALLTNKVRIYRVANTTERNALATTLSPTQDAPLFVFRSDVTTDRNLEWTTDGSTWMSYMPPTAGVASRTSSVNMSSGASVQTVSLTSFSLSGNIASTTNGLVIQRSGSYLVSARIQFAANGTGNRMCIANVSDVESHLNDIRSGVSGNSTTVNATGYMDLEQGQVVTLGGWQTSGGSLATSFCSLTVVRLT